MVQMTAAKEDAAAAKDDAGGGDRRTLRFFNLSSKKGLLASIRERQTQQEEPEQEHEAVSSSTDPPLPSRSPRSPWNRGRFAGFFSSTPQPPSTSNGNTSTPLMSNVNKLLTPSKTFVRLRDEKEELSRVTPSPPSHGFRDGFNLPLIGEVKPNVVIGFAKKWLRNPKNIAFLIWIVAVAVSGAILFMVMVGMLNSVLPSKNARNTWFEVSNQIINALFTLMALYLHPTRILHLHMLIRWKASDIVKLRKIYCKNETRKPHEWGHMLVVVLLLHLNCIAQYCLCGLNWGYRRAQRPAIGVAICLCTSFGAGAAAGVYNIVSPLGKDFEVQAELDSDSDTDHLGRQKRNSRVGESEFVPRTRIYRLLERRVSFAYRDEGSVVEKPEWKGGVMDIGNEKSVCVLSTICSFCVFGWNMERLGFGNRYVHIITFALICTAPFWIFDLAALNIKNHYVRNAVGGSGIALCAFGLFYGGYWRIQMRERFNLPGNNFCCGKPSITDCFQWLFLPFCSLSQEVRTAEFYDVKDDRFYSRARMGPDSPLPGFASPRTPAPTLSAVKEGSQDLREMSLDDVELRDLDNPDEKSMSQKRPLSPPPQMTAIRDQTPPNDSPKAFAPPALPGSHRNPFVNEGGRASPSRYPFPQPEHEPRGGTGGRGESPPVCTSTATNSFLQPPEQQQQVSRGGSPLHSPNRLSSTTSNNPFSTSSPSAGEGFLPPRSPLRSPHHHAAASPSRSPFSPQHPSSALVDGSPLYSPHHHIASPSRTPLSPQHSSSSVLIDASPLRSPHRSSSPNNPFGGAPGASAVASDSEGTSIPARTSTGSGNPFLHSEKEGGSDGKH